MTRKKTSKPVSFLLLGSREIAASEFKARCLEIMDEVNRTGKEVVITKHRKPVAKLVPIQRKEGGFVGSLKHIEIWYDDIISPTGVEWTADEDNLT